MNLINLVRIIHLKNISYVYSYICCIFKYIFEVRILYPYPLDFVCNFTCLIIGRIFHRLDFCTASLTPSFSLIFKPLVEDNQVYDCMVIWPPAIRLVNQHSGDRNISSNPSHPSMLQLTITTQKWSWAP